MHEPRSTVLPKLCRLVVLVEVLVEMLVEMLVLLVMGAIGGDGISAGWL